MQSSPLPCLLPDQIRTLPFDFSSGRASGNLIDACAFAVCESKNIKYMNEEFLLWRSGVGSTLGALGHGFDGWPGTVG